MPRPALAGSRRRSGVATGDRSAPIPSRRTSIDRFARRAATATAQGDADILEVGIGGRSFRSLFPVDRYRSISIRPDPTERGSGGVATRRPFAVLPVASDEFGVVLCSGVLQRTAEPLGMMAEMSRALRTGGRLFLTAPLIVPEPTEPRMAGRQRFGLNYLLDASGFAIEDLLAVERSSSYAVVARKAEPTGRRRRRSDQPGFFPVSGALNGGPAGDPGLDDEPPATRLDRTTIELPPIG